jgi:signal transduction histidine kinase
MNENLILPKISPIRLIGFGSFIGIILITVATLLALQKPWLGIQVSYQPDSSVLKIKKVIENGPAWNKLKAGDEIIGIESAGKLVASNPLYNIEEPAIIATYEKANAFFRAQDELASLLTNETLKIHLTNRSITLSPQAKRPLASLPLINYWFVVLYGFTAFIIGLNVWSFRRGEVVTRILAIAGSSFFIGALFNAINLSREIAYPADFFYSIASISHFGVILFAFSAVAILWNYPKRISSFPATLLLYLFFLFIWINQTWQFIQLPFHAYYFHFLIDFIFLTAFAIRQWHQARDSAIDQAALQWLLFTLVISLGITIAFFYIPTIYSTQPLISISTTFFSALLVFIGLTMGIIKYRLFNLSQVWLEAWVWIIGGSILLLIDLALIYLLELASGFAFALSAVIVGWVYFPARQWISINVLKLQPRSIEYYFPVLIDKLIAIETSKTLFDKWEDILKEIFHPLEIIYIDEPREKIKLINNNISLLVPSLDSKSTLSLNYRNNGKKLYTQNDIRLCTGIFDLTRYTANIKHAHEEGAQEERKRIARDLHDDIASQLLTLIHRSNDLAITEKSRDILKTLRETIYSLDTEATIDVRTVLDHLFELVHERIELAGIALEWEVEKFNQDITLSPRQHINLKRIMQEAISNIIKHANARQVTVFINVNFNNMQLQICDDGIGGNIEDWIAGKGLNNIRTRIEEINGQVSWHHNAKSGITSERQGCCINLQFPLSAITTVNY